MQATPERCSVLPREERGACKRRQATELQRHWLSQLARGADQRRLWQVQLWLGVFPVNWRQLLDPALQISLNGPANHRRNPNENLARELLELFSLGEGHYSEADVREAARALSGYRLDAQQQLVLDPRRHDAGSKTILGRRADFNAASLALWLAEQPATACHISARIWRQQVGSPPSPQRLDALATGWR